MNIDRYSLAESELEVLERIGLRRRDSGAQTGEPQIGRVEFPVIAIGVFDLGRIAGRPGHGFFHARSPVSAWEPIPNPQQRFCAKSFWRIRSAQIKFHSDAHGRDSWPAPLRHAAFSTACMEFYSLFRVIPYTSATLRETPEHATLRRSSLWHKRGRPWSISPIRRPSSS